MTGLTRSADELPPSLQRSGSAQWSEKTRVISNRYRSNTLQPKKLDNVGPKTGLINQSAINLYSSKFAGPYRYYHLIWVRADVIELLSFNFEFRLIEFDR